MLMPINTGMAMTRRRRMNGVTANLEVSGIQSGEPAHMRRLSSGNRSAGDGPILGVPQAIVDVARSDETLTVGRPTACGPRRGDPGLLTHRNGQ